MKARKTLKDYGFITNEECEKLILSSIEPGESFFGFSENESMTRLSHKVMTTCDHTGTLERISPRELGRLWSEAEQKEPPLEQWVHTAAILAAGQSLSGQLQDAVGKAKRLWHECKREREDSIRLRVIWSVHREYGTGVPTPHGPFPADIDDCLKVLIPGKRKQKRREIFDAFLEEKKKSASCEFDRLALVGFQKPKITEFTYGFLASSLSAWLKRRPSENGRHAAQSRWNGNGAHKKHLDSPSSIKNGRPHR